MVDARSKKKSKKTKRSRKAKLSSRTNALGYTDGGQDIGVYETARILSQQSKERDRVKRQILDDREKFKAKMHMKREIRTEKWRQKLQKSPFRIDLVAESERLEEGNRVRLREEEKRAKVLEKRKMHVKNEIILRALQEASDLEALRAEKRMILKEENRLKAMLDLEKANSCRKSDLMAAVRAERQRKQMQLDYRRQQRLEYELAIKYRHREALKKKLGIEQEPKDLGCF